jgi:hypothetical protein
MEALPVQQVHWAAYLGEVPCNRSAQRHRFFDFRTAADPDRCPQTYPLLPPEARATGSRGGEACHALRQPARLVFLAELNCVLFPTEENWNVING